MTATPGIWAYVVTRARFTKAGRRLVRIERGYCFIEDPDKDIDTIKPKHLERIDSLILVVDSGFWNYGKVDMRFDSSVDADEVERQLRKLLA